VLRHQKSQKVSRVDVGRVSRKNPSIQQFCIAQATRLVELERGANKIPNLRR
jgi:hypothetical protein